LVTGASRGIGRGIADALGREGAHIALAARSGSELQEAAGEIRKGGSRALALTCDLTRQEDIEDTVRSTLDEFGRVDFLINNAGVGLHGKVDELSVEKWDEMMAINLRAVFLMTRTVVPAMRSQGGGHIVNISSVAGLVGNPGLSAYNASKFGLMGFSEATMLELRHDHIKVTAVCPGSTDSYFGGAAMGKSGRENFLSVEDVAHAVVEVLATAPNALISQVHIRPLIPPKR
jgi:short-subunit dehydrogenase